MASTARFGRRHRQRVRRSIEGTAIGDIDGPTAIVASDGTIGGLDGAWRFEWGAGADDRWHLAHLETSVRQTRVDDAPVFETSMRIPSGDLVCRVGSVTDGLSRSLMIEFRNDSPGGVVLGCVLSVAAESVSPRLTVDPSEVAGGGRVLLRAARRAGGVSICHNEPWQSLAEGPDQTPVSVNVRTSRGSDDDVVHAAMAFPLPHRASLIVRIAVDGEFHESPSTLAEVARGWRSITKDAADIKVPDQALGEAWRRVVPDLVIAAGSADLMAAAEAAPFLDLAGLHDEADRARTNLIAAIEEGQFDDRVASEAIAALASRDLRAGRSSGLDQLVAGLVASAGEDVDPSALLLAAAAIRPTAGRAGDELLDLYRRRERLGTQPPRNPTTRVAEGAAKVLGHVVGPITSRGVDAVDLLPQVPRHWYGGQVDVRGLATHAGRISYSVRWHGQRPALLWDRDGGPENCEITCSGLDDSWSATDRSGEALLHAPGASASKPR